MTISERPPSLEEQYLGIQRFDSFSPTIEQVTREKNKIPKKDKDKSWDSEGKKGCGKLW